MDELERGELREDVNQLKVQMAQMLEILQSLEKRNTDGTPSAVNDEQVATPSHPPGFPLIPMQLQSSNPQGVLMPLTVYPNIPIQPPIINPQEVHVPPFPPYGLPPGFVPPQATNPPDGNTSTPTLNPTQPQGPHPNSIENPQTETPFPVSSAPMVPPILNTQNVSQPHSNPVYVATNNPHGVSHDTSNNSSIGILQSMGKLEVLEERLRTIEGGSNYGLGNASELCLVPNVVIPPKFKVPDFDKYKGTTCPKSHLTMYCRKMALYAQDENLLIHFFQDSLKGAASNWYTHLERAHIRCWKDLADAFLKQYKYNIDMAPDRLQLQNMTKKDVESFKKHAQRWRELSAQVDPPLSEKEMVATFIDTLQSSFYDRMIGSVSSNFSDIVIIGERVENGIRSGKITPNSMEAVNMKKPSTGIGRKEEGETHVVTFNQQRFTQGKPNPTYSNPQPSFQTPFTNYPDVANTSHTPYPQPYHSTTPYHSPPPSQPQTFSTVPSRPPQSWAQNSNPNQRRTPNNQERKPFKFDPIPMSYTELSPHLIQSSLVVPCPMKPLEPPYPRGFDVNAKCDYHAGIMGHSTENCNALKFK
ncbi:uncharacterized protein LOC133290532, partial [Gastrolobium bilobum]|uniref:uncharacterized protein LOC133290532 n=1 Tax=Gastrolobium bilobum TaxID=150636 RepID=UPI002AB21CA3